MEVPSEMVGPYCELKESKTINPFIISKRFKILPKRRNLCFP